MQYPWKPGEGGGFSGTEITNTCLLPRGCWGLNPGLLEEQPLILAARPSLQPCGALFLQFPISLKLLQNKKWLQCDKFSLKLKRIDRGWVALVQYFQRTPHMPLSLTRVVAKSQAFWRRSDCLDIYESFVYLLHLPEMKITALKLSRSY